jgi:hypothetical protein
MAGVHGQVLGHLVRRGVSAAQDHFAGANAEHIQKLQHDAELYDNAGPEMEVDPVKLLPLVITGFLTILIIAAVCIPS